MNPDRFGRLDHFGAPGVLLSAPRRTFAALPLRACGGHQDDYELLCSSLVADASALMQLGWALPLATPAALAALMRASVANG